MRFLIGEFRSEELNSITHFSEYCVRVLWVELVTGTYGAEKLTENLGCRVKLREPRSRSSTQGAQTRRAREASIRQIGSEISANRIKPGRLEIPFLVRDQGSLIRV